MNRYSYCFNSPMILVDLDGALTAAIPVPFLNDFIGGAAGSIATDSLENLDNPGSYDISAITKHAFFSAMAQTVISGPFDAGTIMASKTADALEKWLLLLGASIFSTGSGLSSMAINKIVDGMNCPQ